MSVLPQDWDSMTISQQMAAVFMRLASTETTLVQSVDALKSECRELRETVKNQNARINSLENANASIQAEIDQIKELRVRALDSSELKIVGIPPSNNLPFYDIVLKS